MRYACLSTCNAYKSTDQCECTGYNNVESETFILCKIHIIEIKLFLEENTQLPLILGYCLEDKVWNQGHGKTGLS